MRFLGCTSDSDETARQAGGDDLAGADAVVIQENTTREGDLVVVTAGAPDPAHVRPRGLDFGVGEVLLRAGKHLDGELGAQTDLRGTDAAQSA